MQITITTKQAVGSLAALGYLSTAMTFSQGIGVQFGLALKQCRDVNETYDIERAKLLKKFAKKDADGKVMKRIVGNGEEIALFDDDGQEAWDDARRELLKQTVTITVEQIKYSQLVKDKIPAHVYGDLDWMIIPDPAPKPATEETA